MIEQAPDDLEGKIDRGNVRKFVSELELLSKKGLKFGGGTIVGELAGGVGVGAVLNAPSIVSTQNHIKRLRELSNHPQYNCSCGHCEDVIDYAIKQKSKKETKKKVGSVPVVSWGGTAYAIYRFIKKGKSRGEDREAYARLLWSHAKLSNASVRNEQEVSLLDFEGSRGDCIKAKAVIAELVGNYTKLKSWEKAEALVSVQFGPSIIAEKLKSS